MGDSARRGCLRGAVVGCLREAGTEGGVARGGRGEGILSRGAAGFVWKDSARQRRLQGAVAGGVSSERETEGYTGRSVAEDKDGVVYGGRGEGDLPCGARVARGGFRTAWVFAGRGRGVLERGGAEGGVARGGEVKVSRRAGFAAKVFRHTDGTTGQSPGTGRDGEGLDGRMDGAGAWMRGQSKILCKLQMRHEQSRIIHCARQRIYPTAALCAV